MNGLLTKFGFKLSLDRFHTQIKNYFNPFTPLSPRPEVSDQILRDVKFQVYLLTPTGYEEI